MSMIPLHQGINLSKTSWHVVKINCSITQSKVIPLTVRLKRFLVQPSIKNSIINSGFRISYLCFRISPEKKCRKKIQIHKKLRDYKRDLLNKKGEIFMIDELDEGTRLVSNWLCNILRRTCAILLWTRWVLSCSELDLCYLATNWMCAILLWTKWAISHYERDVCYLAMN